MKNLVLALSIVLGFSATAHANMDLARSKNCLACHAVDRKLVGPSFKAIAERYKNDKSAEAKLIANTMRGGGGVWGPIPMPSNPQLSEAEAKQLIQWILSKQ